MNTLPDTPQPAMGADHTDATLLRAVAKMRPGWIVLRDCGLAHINRNARARARYALLHPKIGIALLDVLPGTTTPGAPDRVRRLLDAANFRSAFGDYPPIVYLCVPSRTLSSLGLLLAGEFNLLPPLALAGGDAWAGAARQVLTAEPPLRQPGHMTTGEQPLPFRAPEPARTDGRFGSKPGLAAFWGVVALVFGGGALVLQHLGPPEELSAAAHANVGLGEPQVPLASSEAWTTSEYRDQARLPSPGPVLALWPAGRMPPQFDTARAGATFRETGDLAGVGLHPTGDRLASGGAAFPDVSLKQPGLGVRTEAHSATAAKILAGMDATGFGTGTADGVSDSARASPLDNGSPVGESGTSATATDAPHGFTHQAPTASGPAGGPNSPAAALLGPAAPLPARHASGEGTSAASTVFDTPESAPADAPTAIGLDGSSSSARNAPPPQPTPTGAEATPAAAGKAASADAASSPSTRAADDVRGAGSGAGADGAAAAARAAGPDVPPSPHSGATAPAQASGRTVVPSGAAETRPAVGGIQASEHTLPPSSQTQDDHGDADPRPRPDVAGPAGAAGAAAPSAPPRAPGPSAAQETGPLPGSPPVSDAQATGLPAGLGPPAPGTTAVPPGGEAPPVAAVDAAPPGPNLTGGATVPPPSEPPTPPPAAAASPEAAASDTVLGGAAGSGQPAAAPQQAAVAPEPPPQPAPPAEPRGPSEAGVPSLPGAPVAAPGFAPNEAVGRSGAAPVPVARPGAMPNAGPPEPGPGRAQTSVGDAVPRPTVPEPDSKAAAQADGTERRAPAAPVPSALAEALITRGDAMVARRDISAARLLYERAAMADARAAAALARTYDPAFLAEIGAQGIRGDTALATAWYRKAISLGDSGALARVEALNDPDRASQGKRP